MKKTKPSRSERIAVLDFLEKRGKLPEEIDPKEYNQLCTIQRAIDEINRNRESYQRAANMEKINIRHIYDICKEMREDGVSGKICRSTIYNKQIMLDYIEAAAQKDAKHEQKVAKALRSAREKSAKLLKAQKQSDIEIIRLKAENEKLQKTNMELKAQLEQTRKKQRHSRIVGEQLGAFPYALGEQSS